MQLLTLFSTLLLASSALAAPGTAHRQETQRKRAAARKGNPFKQHVDAATTGTGVSESKDSSTGSASAVEYSDNWAGAILVGTGYTSVTGTFTAPTPSTDGSGSAWVGIDGDTCSTAILQTGIDWTLSNGAVTYDAWYEWYPNYAYDFSDITISAGDSINVTVVATSLTSGVAYIENLSTGVQVSQTFSNEASEGSLCEYNAEWIVEDFEEDDALVDFADFGSVSWTDCYATDNDAIVGLTGANIIDIKQDTVLTSCSASSDTELTCTYV